jgi:RNA-dependent RNA polymerase
MITSNVNNLLSRRELDREIKATSEGKGRGLGLMGNWEGVENWYGGRIQQIARLVKTAPGEAEQPYKIILEKLESTRSHRFARYLGSLGVLQLGIPKDLVNRERDDVLVFLSRNFVLCGRIYRPFTSKEGKVYFMEIDKDYKRCPDPAQGDQHRISFSQFINWHNPFCLNHSQVC